VLVFGLQSLLYYGTISWLPDVYIERGWTEASAGSLIAVMHLVGLVIGLAVPWAADRIGTRRGQMTSVASVGFLGFLGVVLVPDAAWLWAALIGFGLGAIFPLCLTLPVDMARSPALVGALAALMLLGGYLISGIGPVLLGSVRDATGNFGASLWLLVALAGALVGICLALTPDRLRHGVEPEPTHADLIAPDTIAG
jgi:MFS transporter, CP family, cyanate transporter